jgi:hypothetical protein
MDSLIDQNFEFGLYTLFEIMIVDKDNLNHSRSKPGYVCPQSVLRLFHVAL